MIDTELDQLLIANSTKMQVLCQSIFQLSRASAKCMIVSVSKDNYVNYSIKIGSLLTNTITQVANVLAKPECRLEQYSEAELFKLQVEQNYEAMTIFVSVTYQ